MPRFCIDLSNVENTWFHCVYMHTECLLLRLYLEILPPQFSNSQFSQATGEGATVGDWLALSMSQQLTHQQQQQQHDAEILALSLAADDDAGASAAAAAAAADRRHAVDGEDAPSSAARRHFEASMASFGAGDLTPLAMPTSPSLLPLADQQQHSHHSQQQHSHHHFQQQQQQHVRHVAMNILNVGLADSAAAAAVHSYFQHDADTALGANFALDDRRLPDDMDAKLEAVAHQQQQQQPHHHHQQQQLVSSQLVVGMPKDDSKKRKAPGAVVSVDLQTKIRLIELAEEYQYDPKATGRSKQEPGAAPSREQMSGIRLAAQFGLNKSTVSRILKRKDEFKKAYYKDNISGGSKHINKKSKFEKLNRLVENWFDLTREKKVAVSDTHIRDVGKRFAEELGIDDFRGSNGWVRSLRNRKESQARNLSAEAMGRERMKKDAEAVERMRAVFPNGMKDMAGFFRDLSTFIEKDCGGGSPSFLHGDSTSLHSTNGFGGMIGGSDSDGTSVTYADIDDEAAKEEERVAEEFFRKKVVETLRVWSHELTESELSRLKRRLKPRQVANL